MEIHVFDEVVEDGRTFPLYRVRLEGPRLLVVTAGFHGDEIAGPLTLREHLPEVVAYARARRVGLLVYPCVNPSGFEARTRYNMSGERPNNDFMRYEVAPGEWKGELHGEEPFIRWELTEGGPKETRALRNELLAQPTPAAALDLHQDPWLPGEWAYAYTFGDSDAYRPLVRDTAALVPVVREGQVDVAHHTDEDGLIAARDGSITDWYDRRGARYTAALETTTPTPLDACHAVNLVWLRGFIDLAARG